MILQIAALLSHGCFDLLMPTYIALPQVHLKM